MDMTPYLHRILSEGISNLKYDSFKWSFISKAINDGEVLDYFRLGHSLPEGFGRYIDERAIEYPFVFSRLPDTGRISILDAGSALNFAQTVSHAKLKDSDLTIATLGHEKNCFFERDISYVFSDLRETKFKDGSFDRIVSISTIEHIGCDNTIHYTKNNRHAENIDLGYLSAIREFRRLLKPDGVCLLTFPVGRREFLEWLYVLDVTDINNIVNEFKPSIHSVNFYRNSPSGWRHVEDYKAVSSARYRSLLTPFNEDYLVMPGAEAVACLSLAK